jgi:citrate lyase gamma subunit
MRHGVVNKSAEVMEGMHLLNTVLNALMSRRMRVQVEYKGVLACLLQEQVYDIMVKCDKRSSKSIEQF